MFEMQRNLCSTTGGPKKVVQFHVIHIITLALLMNLSPEMTPCLLFYNDWHFVVGAWTWKTYYVHALKSWSVHYTFLQTIVIVYTPPKKKLLACSTWILKNRGVTFLVSVDIGHSSAPSGHFKICKWKGEEFLFWVSVYTDTGYGLKQPIKSCEKFRLWVGNGVNLFSVKWSQSRLGVVVLAWSRNRRRSLNWLEPSISDSQK